MSRIGRANLNLQEQAEELGFETVQSALDCGYKAILDRNGEMRLVTNVDEELEKAHKEYEHRKKIIIDKLEMLINDTPYQVYKDTLKEAIDFIKEGEV